MLNLLKKYFSTMDQKNETDDAQAGPSGVTSDEAQAGPSGVQNVRRASRASLETVSEASDWPTGTALSTPSTSPTELGRWLRGELVEPVECIELSSGSEDNDERRPEDELDDSYSVSSGDSDASGISETPTEEPPRDVRNSGRAASPVRRHLRRFRGTSVRMLVLPEANDRLWDDLEEHLAPYSYLFLPPQVIVGSGTYGYDQIAHFCAPIPDDGIVEVYCSQWVPTQGDANDYDYTQGDATYMMAYPTDMDRAWRPARRIHQRYTYTTPPIFPVPDELLHERQRQWMRVGRNWRIEEEEFDARPQTAKRGRR